MFNERIKLKREEKKLSQAELARRVGISRDLYNKYERAGIRPSHETLVLLSEELETTVDYLLGKDDPTPPGDRLIIPEVLKDVQLAFHRGEFEDLTQSEIDALAVAATALKANRKL